MSHNVAFAPVRPKNDARKMMADAKFYMDYARWIETENRHETWEEAVERVMNMHREKYAGVMTPELEA